MFFNVINNQLIVWILVHATWYYHPNMSQRLGDTPIFRSTDLDPPPRPGDLLPFQNVELEILREQPYVLFKFPCPQYQSSNIIYALYTRTHKDQPCFLNPDSNDTSASLKECNFKTNTKTAVLIHGYRAIGIPFFKTTKDAYLQVRDMNVLIVDWSYYSPCYYNAILYDIQEPLAYDIYRVINLLLEYGTTTRLIHVVGHSIGAQLAGLVGKNAANSTNGKYDRITGLDPAQHLYDEFSDNSHLVYTDADFVDVIHTSANHSILPFGTNREEGYIDFWPNGGFSQTLIRGEQFVDAATSHVHAVEFFAESIKNMNIFCSRRCDDYVNYIRGKCDGNQMLHMGEYATKPAERGDYFLKTHLSPPYGIPCEDVSNS